jgi:prolyl-tRNA editing enzyme YbaK/EbsC (Cys-tRNA(Pro) deacylase)
VDGARIAKTLAFGAPAGCLMLVAAGDARVDNKRFKQAFGLKARMLSADETLARTGHPVGGVCPFGLPEGTPVYLDVSLRRFETVFPAVGAGNTAIELTLDELYTFSNAADWVDVCQPPENPAPQNLP